MRAVLVLLVAVALVSTMATGCGRSNGTEAGNAAVCKDVDTPTPRDPGTHDVPSAPLDPAKTYALTFETSCGSFVVTLDPELAPATGASLVALARAGYFDDTIFHRVVRDFVIQGGDPTQTGGGGPGYSTVDAPPSDSRYTKGTVAMAKTLTEPAGTSGSQFFVVTADEVRLPPDYAIVGKVSSGMDAVGRIDALGRVDASGKSLDAAPSQPVVVERVTVSEK